MEAEVKRKKKKEKRTRRRRRRAEGKMQAKEVRYLMDVNISP